ncbi:MAG TPA: hypothetical protein PK686_03265 [bacterium]|nr:hypothetical protein [bacterium]HPV65671.1 hypothetical protein [bacterium]
MSNINFIPKPLPNIILEAITTITEMVNARSFFLGKLTKTNGRQNSSKKEIKNPELQPIAPRAKEIYIVSMSFIF